MEPYEAVGRVSEGCPIGSLVMDLAASGKPSLAWLVRWSRDGEPLHEAWKRAYDDTAMRLLLREVGHPLGFRPAKNPLLKCHGSCRASFCLECSDAIRAAVQDLPTLSELLNRAKPQ